MNHKASLSQNLDWCTLVSKSKTRYSLLVIATHILNLISTCIYRHLSKDQLHQFYFLKRPLKLIFQSNLAILNLISATCWHSLVTVEPDTHNLNLKPIKKSSHNIYPPLIKRKNLLYSVNQNKRHLVIVVQLVTKNLKFLESKYSI